MAGPDYIVDIEGLRGTTGRLTDHVELARDDPANGGAGGADRALRGRPWLAVYWKCCRTYSRLYRNPAGTAYRGQCPRCGSRASAVVGNDGTSARFFTAQ